MRRTILFIVIICFCYKGVAQTTILNTEYHRSSLYSILIKHTEKEFCQDIVDVFKSIPIPEKFNEHNLSKRVLNAITYKKTEEKNLDQKDGIDQFLEVNAIGRRLIAKWFNRDNKTGICNMDLITQRGFYDANLLQVKLANLSVRGKALLADAGEELIGHTFVLVNDIRYVNKEETAGIFTTALNVVGSAAGAGSIVESAATLGSSISSNIAGFKVIVTSYLYQLEWDEKTAGTFYSLYYMGEGENDENKRKAFAMDRKTFQLRYIGSQSVFSGKTSLKGIHSDSEMIRKVCTRAIDKSIAQLQKAHDEFKVKTPLVSTEPLTAYIGKKEDVDEESRFEVLEITEGMNGTRSYKRVGIIKPVKGKIWDNRYMASEDEFEGAGLNGTAFQKVSGGDFYPGMLIREIE